MRSEQVEYRFNLSTVASTEKILTAELHLFKLRPQATLAFTRHHFCQVCARARAHYQTHLWFKRDCKPISVIRFQVSVYQIMDTSRGNNTQDKKLLSSRLIPVHSAGWEVFTITQAVSRYFWSTRQGETRTASCLRLTQLFRKGPLLDVR